METAHRRPSPLGETKLSEAKPGGFLANGIEDKQPRERTPGPLAGAGCCSGMIVIFTGSYLQQPICNTVHQPMSIIDPSAPKTTQITPKRLRFSNPIERITLYIPNQHIETLQNLFVVKLPIEVVLPCFIIPYFLHSSASISSCSLPRPEFNLAIASRIRAWLDSA